MSQIEAFSNSVYDTESLFKIPRPFWSCICALTSIVLQSIIIIMFCRVLQHTTQHKHPAKLHSKFYHTYFLNCWCKFQRNPGDGNGLGQVGVQKDPVQNTKAGVRCQFETLSAVVFWWTGTLILWSTDYLMHWCTDALVHWCTKSRWPIWQIGKEP